MFKENLEVKYKGKKRREFSKGGTYYVALRRKVFGGYSVTPYRGYGLDEKANERVHYENLVDLMADFEIIASVELAAVSESALNGKLSS